MVIGPRFAKHAVPTTYKRITPDRGCGFILKRIYDLTENPKMPRGSYCKNPTKQDIYCGTSWANRPGFASLLWSALIEDGLIASEDGMAEYAANGAEFTRRSGRKYKRAKGHFENGKYVVRYQLTPKGRGVLFDMMDRIPDSLMRLNTVGSVAEYDAKKDFEELEKLAEADRPEILRKEAVDCARLAADYAGENQKLRAEKDSLNARLKNMYHRLGLLECDIQALKDELNNIVNWTK